MDNLLISLSNSKIFTGALMLLTNIGGKYLSLEIPPNIDKLFTHHYILRYFVLFSIFFMATRDVKISLVLSLLFFIIIRYFINEKSSFCLFSDDKNVTKEEYEKAKEVIKKFNEKSNM
jgi:hypothetical protein